MLKKLGSVSYRETNQFPKLFLDYVDNDSKLNSFYDHKPNIEAFKEAISKKSTFNPENRRVLKNHLIDQYSGITISKGLESNIDSLTDKNTFTVTTGHQLNLFTGPLYFIYKIITVIKLAEELKEKYPENNFIPVYWMASEDHDFEEIQFFNYRGKKYKWDNDQNGPVGRFELAEIEEYISSLPCNSNLKKHYLESSTLGEAHLKIVNDIFGDKGLIVLDADSKELKIVFSTYVKNDIENSISYDNVKTSTEALNQLKYRLPVNPRKINYFNIDEGRKRLELENGKYFEEHNEEWKEVDLFSILKDNPKCISPNVITRPLYQEIILPNLAYIGGPSELSYWLQLKSFFDAMSVPFPIIFPRLSASILSRKALDKKDQLGIESYEQLFLEERELFKSILKKSGELDTSIFEEWNKQLNELFRNISEDAEKTDKTLKASAEGRKVKAEKSIIKLWKKMETAQIRKNDIAEDRLQVIFDELFPKGSFQERHKNVIEHLEEDENFIDNLIEELPSPFDFMHHLLSY